MASAPANSMAAVLSTVLRIVFWLLIVLGAFSILILGMGLLGALNGGAIKMPMIEAVSEGVPSGQILAAMISAAIFFTGAAYVCHKLRQILETLADGDPFVPENAPRLTRIAVVIGLIELVRLAALVVLRLTVELGADYRASVNFNLAVWGAVLVLLVLAQVFKEGTRLREEEKMTI